MAIESAWFTRQPKVRIEYFTEVPIAGCQVQCQSAECTGADVPARKRAVERDAIHSRVGALHGELERVALADHRQHAAAGVHHVSIGQRRARVEHAHVVQRGGGRRGL